MNKYYNTIIIYNNVTYNILIYNPPRKFAVCMGKMSEKHNCNNKDFTNKSLTTCKKKSNNFKDI